MTDEVVALAPTGQLSSGFPVESFKQGMAMNPDFIGVDSGSTDPGPWYLGAGISMGSKEIYRKYLMVLLRASRERGIPLLIGSAATSGGEPHLQWLVSIIEEIASSDNMHFTMAVIHSEQRKDYLKQKLAQGRIKPLNPWKFKMEIPLSNEIIDRSERIVGVMGVEPYVDALRNGAEVVVAGRSTDTAIFAAVPLMRGLPPALVWHAAKILECGAAAVEQRPEDECLMARITHNSFTVWPPNKNLRCTPLSVRSHMLYENPSPYHMYEPSGMLDASQSVYDELDKVTVRVSGSKWVPAEKYAVKLEGVENAGYRSIFVAGIRDSVLINEIDSFLKRAEATWESKIPKTFPGLTNADYRVAIKVYGKNAVMGPLEPVEKITSHELGILGEVIARTEELSAGICYLVYRVLLHQHYGRFSGLLTGLAVPFAPEIIKVGVAYRFNMNHLVEPDDPLQMFRTEFKDV